MRPLNQSLPPIVAERQTTVKAGLRPPPTAAHGLDSGLPLSRLAPIGSIARKRMASGKKLRSHLGVAIFCGTFLTRRRIDADSGSHRQGWAQKAQSNKRSSMFVEVYAATATAINLIMRAGQMTPQYLALSLFQ